MAKTEFTGLQTKDGSIGRDDLDSATAGQAVVRKLIAGSGVTLSSTGADAGTGDVTVNSSGSLAPAPPETIIANATLVSSVPSPITIGEALTLFNIHGRQQASQFITM